MIFLPSYVNVAVPHMQFGVAAWEEVPPAQR